MAFHLWDYCVWSVCLSTFMWVAVAFCIWKPSSISQFVHADSNANLFAIGCAFALSIFSIHILLTFPSLSITVGFTWLWVFIGAICAAALVSLMLVPILHHVRSISIFDYLLLRLKSSGLVSVRLVTAVSAMCFLVSNILCSIAIVLINVKCVSTVMPVIPEPVLIALIGCLTAIPLCFGGIKAIHLITVLICLPMLILSSCTLFIALFRMQVQPIYNFQFKSVFNQIKDDLLQSDLDVFHSNSAIWISVASFVYFLVLFGVDQFSAQSYCSTNISRKSKSLPFLAVFIAIVLLITVSFPLTSILLLQFSDSNERLNHRNVTATNKSGTTPILSTIQGSFEQSIDAKGVFGATLAALMLPCMAQLATKLHAAAIVLYEQIVKNLLVSLGRSKSGNDDDQFLVLRLLHLVLTALISLTAFAVNFYQFAILFTVEMLLLSLLVMVPVLGIFLVAISFSSTNAKGCLVGLVAGICSAVALSALHLYKDPYLLALHAINITNHRYPRDQNNFLVPNQTAKEVEDLVSIISNRSDEDVYWQDSDAADDSSSRYNSTEIYQTLKFPRGTSFNIAQPNFTANVATTATSLPMSSQFQLSSQHLDWKERHRKNNGFVSALLFPAIVLLVAVLGTLIGSVATGGAQRLAIDWNLLYCTCDLCADRIDIVDSSSRRVSGRHHTGKRSHRANYQPIGRMSSESFKAINLPDTSYANPKVLTLQRQTIITTRDSILL